MQKTPSHEWSALKRFTLGKQTKAHTHPHTLAHMLLFMRSRANNPLLFCYHSPYTQNHPFSHPFKHPFTHPNHPQHSARCGCFCPCPPPLNFYLICRLRKLIVCLLLSVKTMENILATVTLRRKRIRRRPPKTLGPKTSGQHFAAMWREKWPRWV